MPYGSAAAALRQANALRSCAEAATAMRRRHKLPGWIMMMKLSARNQIAGTVTEVVLGQTTGHVHIDIGHGVTVHSSITNEAIDDLGIKVGDKVYAVIKASDVMVAK
jgi:molybdopterin-binding protein